MSDQLAPLDRVLATKTLTVAVGTDWGKMSFLNDKHELDGSDVDIANAIAKYLGVKAKFVTPAWVFITAGEWEGRWDMAMGQLTPTKARAEKLSFPVVSCLSWLHLLRSWSLRSTRRGSLEVVLI
ncbi:transporter substrate-binding domain-containing protein [Mesorhizobium amorphae]|uniref:transporter substrate-binding domain-containing protein n=1 Tax=Mesorhizobium amorphae TaxID=71433 RepID=UPI001AED3129|nr:transporter substrate-binding domain-containing protein [Mesorhizobium amorphae]